MAFALAFALFAFAPTTAFAVGAGQDTQTDEVEIAATENAPSTDSNGSSGQGGSSGKGASSGSKTSTPGTGDDTSLIAPACLALGASALIAAGAAAKRFASDDK